MPWTARTVAIVGPDGSGKTTQARLLVERLQAAGYEAEYVHALYYLSDLLPESDRLRRRVGPRKTRTHTRSTHGGSYLARRLLFGWLGYWFAVVTILFVSVRFRNRIVVFDRYYQQFFYDVYGPAAVPLAHALPQPWRTVHLDADLDTVRARLDAVDRTADEQYYVRAIDVYDACATDDWLRLRAETPITALHERIFEDLRRDIDAERATAASFSLSARGDEAIDNG